jgi:hypothetical protein
MHVSAVKSDSVRVAPAEQIHASASMAVARPHAATGRDHRASGVQSGRRSTSSDKTMLARSRRSISLACEHEGAAEPVRMSGRPAAWSRGLLPVTLRPCIPVVGTIISTWGRSGIRSIGLGCRRSPSDHWGSVVLWHRWVKDVTIETERGWRLLGLSLIGLSLNRRNHHSKDEAQECKTRHDSPPCGALLITPSALPDRACRLILLSKLSIDFDPSRAHGFCNRAAE